MVAISNSRADIIQRATDLLVPSFETVDRADIEGVVSKALGKVEVAADEPITTTIDKVVAIARGKLTKKPSLSKRTTEDSSGSSSTEFSAPGAGTGITERKPSKNPMVMAAEDALYAMFPKVEKALVKKSIEKAFTKLNDKGEIDLEDPLATIPKLIALAAKKIQKKTNSSEGSDSEEETISKEAGAPAPWKRHVVILVSGTVASVSTSLMPDTSISVIATLGFFKFVKGYALHVPRFRRIVCLTVLAGGAIALQHYVPSVNLIPILGGLGLEAASQTGKAWMKGKMDKDAGPEETWTVFKAAESCTATACSSVYSLLSSGVSAVSSCVQSCVRRNEDTHVPMPEESASKP